MEQADALKGQTAPVVIDGGACLGWPEVFIVLSVLLDEPIIK
jgi:hypothetical protein